MENKELLIIIPTYNEGNNILRLLMQLEELGMKDKADILIVNDASTDATNWIVKEMHYPMLSQLYNMGYGCALQTGYKYAVRRGYQYVIQMDGDGQHDVCNIPVIYQKLTEQDADGQYPDIVLGARFMEGSADFPVSLPKRIVYSMFRRLIRMAKQKQGSYLEELQKIELEMNALERKKKALLSKKKDEDMKALAAFLEQNSISAEDAMEMLSPVAAAATKKDKEV